jgi:hypothetical protein
MDNGGKYVNQIHLPERGFEIFDYRIDCLHLDNSGGGNIVASRS